jgi:RNA polymerase sigma-70 factor (ECF subfamily)
MTMSLVVESTHGLAATLSLHLDEPSDEALIAALAGGATWAMDLLYQRYSRTLYSLAYRMVNDRQTAEDLLQEVFLKVWRYATSYTPQLGSVSSWLMSIMRNRAIDHQRSARRHVSKNIPLEESEQDPGGAFTDAWDEVWLSVQISLVRACLMRLPPEQRTVIELAYFEGRTQSEIAKMHRLPLGTVKARMRLGLQHLRRELEKRGIGGLR